MDRWRSAGGHLDDSDHLIWRADRLWLSRWPSAVVWLRPLRECPAPARAKDPGRRRANCWPLRGNPFHRLCTPPAVKQSALIRFTINRIVRWAVLLINFDIEPMSMLIYANFSSKLQFKVALLS